MTTHAANKKKNENIRKYKNLAYLQFLLFFFLLKEEKWVQHKLKKTKMK